MLIFSARQAIVSTVVLTIISWMFVNFPESANKVPDMIWVLNGTIVSTISTILYILINYHFGKEYTYEDWPYLLPIVLAFFVGIAYTISNGTSWGRTHHLNDIALIIGLVSTTVLSIVMKNTGFSLSFGISFGGTIAVFEYMNSYGVLDTFWMVAIPSMIGFSIAGLVLRKVFIFLFVKDHFNEVKN